MALATRSEAPPTTAVPPVDTPGLSARLSRGVDDLLALVADLHPELVSGADAVSLFAGFARLSRLADGAKTILAPRIAESNHWREAGHRSPVDLLATLEGGSPSQARRTLETGRLLSGLPATEEAVRSGVVSGVKATEIAQAATLDPASEGSLLDGVEGASLREVKERAGQVRATSSRRDPLAAARRIHAQRSFSSWTDAEGAFCFQGRDSAERGAKLLCALNPMVDRLRDDARVAAKDARLEALPGSPPGDREPEAALRADAFFLLVTGSRCPVVAYDPGSPDGGDPGSPDGGDTGHTPTATPTPGDALHQGLVATTPPAMVLVRVDLAALKRGHVLPGECCELDGQGPVPVAVARSLLTDAFLASVFTEAGDIRAVSHHGRTINQRLRTALAFRDRCCVVPGCGVAYGLEIDHVVPMEHGGPTELDNLALLCHHHHWSKTYEGWTLTRTGPSDEDPGWTFTPLPPFGQKPDLGLDRPPEPVPKT